MDILIHAASYEAKIETANGTFTDKGTTGLRMGVPRDSDATVTVNKGRFFNLSFSASTAPLPSNVAPTVSAGDDTSVTEGAAFSRAGSFSDPDTDSWTATVDYGDGSGSQVLALGSDKSFDLNHTYADNGSYTVTVTVNDGKGGESSDSLTVTVNNAAPTVGAISAPVAPVAVGTSITASASFTDPGTADTHTGTIEWGDGSTSASTVSSGSVSGSHTYTAAGVYTLKLTVADDDGASDSESFQYVVVYDPEAGFVTGGGWINCPAGAYVADPTLSGKANFGFVSRYKQGATTPSGSTEFNFRVANMSFNSDTYEWLVISGAKAQYKGTGTINGSGNYGFMLTANDGQVSGGGGVDRFRIKVWDKATGSVVYDNQMGDTDDAAASTAIEGGSIVIHKQ